MAPETQEQLREKAALRLPRLEAGDRLDQKTFHQRYEAMTEHIRAELIGGTVYVHSPLKPRHGQAHAQVMFWLGLYCSDTPGVECYDNTTAILGEESEPQPDAYLIVTPETGGQMHYNIDEYLVGTPELIVEVALSSESIDLHAKRADYQKAGVQEYIVLALRQDELHWFALRGGVYQDHPPAADGILRSEVFPGLWLDPAALLRRDAPRIKEVVRQGIASPEHAAFVARLAAARAKGTSS